SPPPSMKKRAPTSRHNSRKHKRSSCTPATQNSTTHDRRGPPAPHQQRRQRLPRTIRNRTAQTPHHDPQRSHLERRHTAHNAARTLRITPPFELRNTQWNERERRNKQGL